MYTPENTSRPKGNAARYPAGALGLPIQHSPIYRGPLPGQGHGNHAGVDASVSCRGLTGLARQMCRDLY